ncbi:MAG: T9SS type A sorting domain-containing protein [Flavobacteriales bacterium]|nr:T9SS type A sorting domain-containing protein [Flavobacteriales bacterium]
MKTLLKLSSVLCCAFFSFVAQAQLEDISLEIFDPAETSVQPVGTTTYRLYAELGASTDFVSAVYAQDGCGPIDISTSTTFYNDAVGGVTPTGINMAFFQFFPSLELDSWITIGASHALDAGANDVNFVSTIPADPYSLAFGGGVGQNFEMIDGAWFTLFESASGFPVGPDNKVLLGQFTTSGGLSFNLNIQIFVDGDTDNPLQYVYNEECPGIHLPALSGGVGCSDPESPCYDPDASEGVCFEWEGCTDPDACGYDPNACLDDGSCFYTCGCNDPEMCNYNPDDLGTDDCYFESGCTDPQSCSYNPLACEDTGCDDDIAGCMNPLASNYLPEASCDQGCEFRSEGKVFNDLNQNGVFDEGEPGLALETVNFNDGEFVAITDDLGNFVVDLFEGEYLVTCLATGAFPFITTGDAFYYDTADDADEIILIGKTYENEINGIAIDLYPNWGGIVCDQMNNFNICYRNMGNVPISGYIEVAPDELMGDYQEVTPIDSIVDGKFYLGFENLQPNEMFFYDIGFTGPSFELMGEYLITTSNAYGFNDDGILVAAGEEQHALEVLCAYDPNDKQTLPVGYEEPHFIEPVEEIEYLIRFQNTGNFYAFDISVIDTISPHLDLSTFHLVANSHSVQTSINAETREIEFFFEDIMLPDSNCCEPDSHGLISYFLTPHQGLPHDTRIENTAHIFFDANPAIVTNTTWNTIYRCDEEFAEFQASSMEVCANEVIEFASDNLYIDDYTWRVDGEEVSTDSLLSYSFESIGSHVIELDIVNPLCEASNSMIIDVLDSPVITASDDQFICEGEEVVLTVNGATSYEWSGVDSEASQVTVSPEVTAVYEVTGSNEIGCSATATITVEVMPIPVLELESNVQLCIGDEAVLMVSGAEIFEWVGEGPGSEITVSPTETTTYEVIGMSGPNCESSATVVVEVIDNPVIDVTEDQEICEGDEVTIGASGAESYDWNGLGESAEITVSPLETTTYEVTGSNEADCSTTEAILVTVNPLPEATFSNNGNILTATDGDAWQWFLDGEAIDGATMQTLEVLEDGNYSVEVYNEAGCMGMSDEVFVMYVGIAEFGQGELKLFPVPVDGNGVLNIGGVNVNNLTNLEIMDASGRMVWSSAKGVSQIALNGLAAGNYVFRAFQNNDIVFIQFVIE